MSRLTATSERVSKEVLVKVEEVKARLLKEVEDELATLKEKAKAKKIAEIGVQATITAIHELVAEGHKVVTILGAIYAKDKAERKNPAKEIKQANGNVISIPESVTPAKTVVAIDKPAEIEK